MKDGDLIYIYGSDILALVIHIEHVDLYGSNGKKAIWVTMLGEQGILHDSLENGYEVIDENWSWPAWHIQ